MKKEKYIKYINYIVNDIQPPYFINMVNVYGLTEKEYGIVLSKVFNQTVIVKDEKVLDLNGNKIYYENSDGGWFKQEYDTNGNLIYFENSKGNWIKYEYDTNGNKIYVEDSTGYWIKKEFDSNGNLIYNENSYGEIRDYR